MGVGSRGPSMVLFLWPDQINLYTQVELELSPTERLRYSKRPLGLDFSRYANTVTFCPNYPRIHHNRCADRCFRGATTPAWEEECCGECIFNSTP